MPELEHFSCPRRLIPTCRVLRAGITDFGQRPDEQGQPAGENREADRQLFFDQLGPHRLRVPPPGCTAEA